MAASEVKSETRVIEKQFEINAPVEDVWKALTDAEELTNWFPLEARVRPGVGGSIWSSWRDEYEADMPIEIWEPQQHLRMIWSPPKGVPDGSDQDQSSAPPQPVVLDYYLEGASGKTILHLVHSGFGVGADWDQQYDGTSRGWNFELRGLKHYLELHRGQRRLVVWARVTMEMLFEQAWEKVLGPNGLLSEGRLESQQEGERYSIQASSGDAFEGQVLIFAPPKDLCLTVENMNNALLRLRVDHSCGDPEKREINLWLSTYGMKQEEVDAIERRFNGMLEGLV